jgi:hypothetical protein
MTRMNFNGVRNSARTRKLLAWGKSIKSIPTNIRGNVNALVFATVLIVCSLAVGCSSDKPKSVSSNNQNPTPQVQTPVVPTPAPAMQAENRPVPKKVVHRKPATVNYTDKNYGISFEYSRRYAIDTGDGAADVVMSNPVPMNFVQPGGVALAAVELPETGFANTDFSSAFFDVSVNKSLTADQCTQFAVPAPKVTSAAAPAETSSQASNAVSTSDSTASASTQSAANTARAQGSAEQSNSNPTVASSTASASDSKADTKTDASAQGDSGSKLMVGNLELSATEAVSGEGTRQSDAKYFHVYQNGACYEFALNVTTVASEDGLMKHVNRDRVFDRLEKILATVKIDELKPAAQDANAASPATPAVAESPAK